MSRFDTTLPLADQITAVRDHFLMATPDKTDTAYAVMTRGSETIAALLEALQALLNACWNADARGDLCDDIDGELMDQARAAITQATQDQGGGSHE